jgi:rubrerythrin
MGIRFSADEAFQMAERIEENGAAFYRRAAELRPPAEKDHVEMLNRLAAMEEDHKRIFGGMRSGLTERMREETAFDPYLEAQMYLDAMADTHGGEGSPSIARSLTGKETMKDILRTAIGLEEKSIVFYLGLKDMVPASLGKDKIDAIIGEEKKHLTELAGELRKEQT